MFHNRRWDGDARTVARLLRDGAVGEVVRFESRFERWRPEVESERWRERPDPSEAGGLLYDLGSHLIDQALWLFGPITHATADVRAVRAGALVDDDVVVALTHADGTRSHLWASAVAADLGPRFRLLGTSAAYVKHGLDPQEAALRSGAVPGPSAAERAAWGIEPASAWGILGTPGDTRLVETAAGDYPAFYEAVRDAMLGAGPPPVTMDEAIGVLEVIEAAQHSARRGETVQLARPQD